MNDKADSKNDIGDIAGSNFMSPEEDSHEWATTTLDALGPVIDAPYPSESQNIPGSFPGSSGETAKEGVSTFAQDAQYVRNMVAETLDHDAQYVKGVAASALGSARDYAVKKGETVGGYLPASVAAYLPASPLVSQNHHSDSAIPLERAAESEHTEIPNGGIEKVASEPSSIVANYSNSPQTTGAEHMGPINSDSKGEHKEIRSSVEEPAVASEPSPPEIAKADHKVLFDAAAEVKSPDDNAGVDSKPSSVEIDPAVTKNTLTTPQRFDEPSETMHEGLGSTKRDGETASADASTRSLAGTQVNEGGYTPGTSIFTRKESTYSPSADDAKDGAAKNAAAGEPFQALAMANDAPVLDGRQYLAVTKKAGVEGAPYEMQQPAADVPHTKAKDYGAPAAGARPEFAVIDSARATTGHGPPVPPPKTPHTAQRTSTSEGANALAAAGAAGASAGGDMGGAGAGNVAASAQPATHAATGAAPTAGAGKKDVEEAAHTNGKANVSAHKKHGLFHKLKHEIRALSGRHDPEEAAK